LNLPKKQKTKTKTKTKTCLWIRFCGVNSTRFFSVRCFSFVVLLTLVNLLEPVMMSSLFQASATLRLLSDPLICATSEVGNGDPFSLFASILLLLLVVKHFTVWCLMGRNWILKGIGELAW